MRQCHYLRVVICAFFSTFFVLSAIGFCAAEDQWIMWCYVIQCQKVQRLPLRYCSSHYSIKYSLNMACFVVSQIALVGNLPATFAESIFILADCAFVHCSIPGTAYYCLLPFSRRSCHLSVVKSAFPVSTCVCFTISHHVSVFIDIQSLLFIYPDVQSGFGKKSSNWNRA